MMHDDWIPDVFQMFSDQLGLCHVISTICITEAMAIGVSLSCSAGIFDDIAQALSIRICGTCTLATYGIMTDEFRI